jgi:protein-S-isoprenylcysteine O-methyltransferase Ste14
MALRVLSAMSSVIGGSSLLGLGVFLWIGSFQVVALGLSGGGVLAWDAALSAVFFIQHSGMIRQAFRRQFERVTPPFVHAAVYSIVSGAALLLVLALWQRSDVVIWAVGPPLALALRMGFVAAIIGFVWGIRALRGFDGFGLRPIHDRARGRTRAPEPLTVRGPYRWVRHPLYTCVLLMIWSCPEVTADRLLFNLLWTGWIVVGTILEEKDLVRDFGVDYVRYRSMVPMLIPWTLRPRWPHGSHPGDGRQPEGH